MSDAVKVNFKQLAPVNAGGGGPLYVTVLSTDGTKLIKLELNRDELQRALQGGLGYGSICLDGSIGGRLVR